MGDLVNESSSALRGNCFLGACSLTSEQSLIANNLLAKPHWRTTLLVVGAVRLVVFISWNVGLLTTVLWKRVRGCNHKRPVPVRLKASLTPETVGVDHQERP